ncbi:unnamed protein product [Ectocarpus sp. 12 AP-2014]
MVCSMQPRDIGLILQRVASEAVYDVHSTSCNFHNASRYVRLDMAGDRGPTETGREMQRRRSIAHRNALQNDRGHRTRRRHPTLQQILDNSLPAFSCRRYRPSRAEHRW